MEYDHHFIEVNGIRMHYVSAGEGPLVILLHGFPEFWYSWKDYVAPLSKHFKVVVPDLRGYNESDKPKGVKNYDMEVLVEDIRALIRALGAEKARIVGHDWGGAITWMLAIRSPEYVERFVVLNLPHPDLFYRGLRKSFRQKLRSWYFFWFQLPWLPEFFFRIFLRPVVRYGFKGWAYNKSAFTEEDLKAYRDNMKKRGVIRSSINYYRAAFRYRKRHQQNIDRIISIPARMIWGENDKALGKELTIGTEKYFDAPFDIHYFPNCSHWVQHEYPEKVLPLIEEFLLKEL